MTEQKLFEEIPQIGDTLLVEQGNDRFRISKKEIKGRDGVTHHICVKRYKLDDEGEARDKPKQLWINCKALPEVMEKMNAASHFKPVKK